MVVDFLVLREKGSVDSETVVGKTARGNGERERVLKEVGVTENEGVIN